MAIWNTPPGTTYLPDDLYDEHCHICGDDVSTCQCPECPECGETGNPDCLLAHDLEVPNMHQYCIEWLREQQAAAQRVADNLRGCMLDDADACMLEQAGNTLERCAELLRDSPTMTNMITNMADLCEHFGADEPAGLNRRMYKDTACGASISVCVRNPHNTRPDRIEMVVKHSTYQRGERELPCLEIEELIVGDRKIAPYLGDNMRDAYDDCQWFQEWERQVMQGRHLSCGNERAEFWPQEPAEVRQGSPRTLADLKATASRAIEYDGRTKLVWDLRHHDEETDTEDRWVWVHNGRSMWQELTMETPIRAFTIQSIVEGSDATVDSDQFDIPTSTEEVDKWMDEMEEETSRLWDRDNHDWYYAFVDDQCVGQFKIGWDDDAFECFDPDNLPLTPREQDVAIRWLNRGSTACLSHEKTRVLTTRVWVERFYQDIW